MRTRASDLTKRQQIKVAKIENDSCRHVRLFEVQTDASCGRCLYPGYTVPLWQAVATTVLAGMLLCLNREDRDSLVRNEYRIYPNCGWGLTL